MPAFCNPLAPPAKIKLSKDLSRQVFHPPTHTHTRTHLLLHCTLSYTQRSRTHTDMHLRLDVCAHTHKRFGQCADRPIAGLLMQKDLCTDMTAVLKSACLLGNRQLCCPISPSQGSAFFPSCWFKGAGILHFFVEWPLETVVPPCPLHFLNPTKLLPRLDCPSCESVNPEQKRWELAQK